MPDGVFQEMFPLASDATPYRKLTGDFVGRETFAGRPILTVAPEALTLLARTAFSDIAHLLRPGHWPSCAASSTTPRPRPMIASSPMTC